MSLQLNYQGREISKSSTEKVYRETYIGTESQVDAKIGTLTIGSSVSGKGKIRSYSKKPESGKFWTLEVEYYTTYDDKLAFQQETTYGRKTATLQTRTVQLPLEKCQRYKAVWNHYLVALSGNPQPSWLSSATSPIITGQDAGKYKWVKQLSDTPSTTEGETPWIILANPTKPGVEYFDFAYFVITQVAKYSSASSAGSSVSKRINTITDPAQKFGITGGDWKLDEASVSYSGKNWLATEVYTNSPDGWDEDLYD